MTPLRVWAQGVFVAAPQPTLTIGHNDRDVPLVRIHRVLVTEACRRVGVSVNFVPLPLPRSLESASNGTTDGDLYRIADAVGMAPNLILVPTSMGRVDVAIYGASDSVVGMTRAQITELSVGAARGVIVLKKQAGALSLSEGSSREAVYQMLMNGRVQAMIASYVDMEGERVAGRMSGMHLWPHLWGREPLYLVLNKRHAALAAKLDVAVREINREGWMNRVYDDEMRRSGIHELPV